MFLFSFTEAIKIFHAGDSSDSHAKLALFFLNRGKTHKSVADLDLVSCVLCVFILFFYFVFCLF